MDLLENWRCPFCGSGRIEEIMVDVVVISTITSVPDDCTDFDFGTQLNEDGEVDRYQCIGCGHTIASDPEGLVKVLSKRKEG